MINFNNHNITGMSYNGHTIKKAYGCDARLVWQSSSKTYFKFKAIDSGTFSMSQKVQYSVNDGLTWTTLDANTPSPTVQAGNYIWWKRNTGGGTSAIGTFSSTGRFEAEGNIMSLVVADAFVDDGKYYTKRTFRRLFAGCTGLASAERIILPRTVIELTYQYMFSGCTSLVSTPELPATTLANSCYNGMFKGCTSLTTVPDLPATVMKPNCYNSMFYDCTSLTSAKVLPATTLADWCYHLMFKGCTNLRTVPDDMLPATTLAYACYASMFKGCTNLINAPLLPANTLRTYSYNAMFENCHLINQITCLATDISATDCTTNWVYGVASSGEFYKNPNMNSWTTGVNGIPTRWAVKDYYPENWWHYNAGDEIPYTSDRYIGIRMAEGDVPQDFNDKISFKDSTSEPIDWADFGVQTEDPTAPLYGVYGCDAGGTPAVLPMIGGYYTQRFSKPMWVSLTKRAPSYIAPFACDLLKEI